MTQAPVSEEEAEKRTLREDLRSLRESPRELWLIYLAKYLESLAYFSMTKMLVLWLSKDFGFTDMEAGWWVATFSSVVTLITLGIGFFADAWGFRKILIAAFASAILARTVMAFAPSRAVAITGLLMITFGTAASVPVMNTAIRRYTSAKNRSFGFSFYYVVMNIGSASAGFLIDWARGLFKVPGSKELVPQLWNFPVLGPTRVSPYGLVFMIGLGCAILAFFVSLLLREGIDMEKPATEYTTAEYRDAEPVEKKASPLQIAIELLREKPFWRFVLFIGLLAMVRLMFQHAFMTFPKYVTRELGADFPFGRVWAINPIMIIILVPIVTALTRRRAAFNVIVLGAFISAFSPFVLVLGASRVTVVAMVVVLSLGEALWSPRLYEYTATIAPHGREGSYLGLSSLPLFVAKMIAGPMSGYLLMTYCPETPPRRSHIMWLIIGVVTLIGPILIILLRGIIEGEKKNKATVEPEPSPA